MLSWLEKHMLPCAYKSVLGIECPACGSQRSFIQLLKGNFAESFIIYPPLVPVILGIMFLMMYFLNNRFVSTRFLKAYFISVLILVITNYIFKMF
jgi:hypothetical protein